VTDVQRWVKPRDAAAEAVVWALIEDFAKARKEAARNWVGEHLRAESMKGVDAVANGSVIGSVTRSKDREVRDVLDEALFLSYIISHHAGVLQVPYMWKNAFLRTLTEVETDSGAVYIDGEGEIVPGVGVRTLAGQVKVNKTTDARAVVDTILSPAEERLAELMAPEPTDRWTQDQEAGAIG